MTCLVSHRRPMSSPHWSEVWVKSVSQTKLLFTKSTAYKLRYDSYMLLELKYSQCSHRLWVQTCLNQVYKPVCLENNELLAVFALFNLQSIYL